MRVMASGAGIQTAPAPTTIPEPTSLLEPGTFSDSCEPDRDLGGRGRVPASSQPDGSTYPRL
jgi:hypothetical protein